MKTLKILALSLAFQAVGLHAESNVVTVDTDAPVLARLGAPKDLEQPTDGRIFYSCRFLLGARNLLLTMRAYTTEPRSELTRGSQMETEKGPIFQLGLRPPVVKWQVELRQLVNNTVVVRTHELVGIEAQELDRFLVCNEIFSLQPLEPWHLINGNGSNTLLAELLLDGRTVVVKRNTEESFPAKAVADRISSLISEMDKGADPKGSGRGN